LKSKIDNLEEQAYPLVAIADEKADIRHNSGVKRKLKTVAGSSSGSTHLPLFIRKE